MDYGSKSFYKRLIMEVINEQKKNVELIKGESFSLPMGESVGEISNYDQHSSDLATETLERSKDLGLLAQGEYILSLCQRSLERLEEGTYGLCERCKKSIDPGRLAIIPYANYCTACQSIEEELHPYHRPIEEEVLFPPFKVKRGFGVLDDQIDRDDAWEIIAKHGNANSPQDANDAFDDDADGERKGNG